MIWIIICMVIFVSWLCGFIFGCVTVISELGVELIRRTDKCEEE